MNRINGFWLTLDLKHAILYRLPPVSGGVSMLKFQVLLSHYRATHCCQTVSSEIRLRLLVNLQSQLFVTLRR